MFVHNYDAQDVDVHTGQVHAARAPRARLRETDVTVLRPWSCFAAAAAEYGYLERSPSSSSAASSVSRPDQFAELIPLNASKWR